MSNTTSSHRAAPAGRSFTELVEGDPLHVSGRVLVPVVRVTSLARRQAHLEGDGVEAQGGGFVNMRPVAVLDRTEDSEERLPIRNGAVRAVTWMILAAMVIPGLVRLLDTLSRRRRD